MTKPLDLVALRAAVVRMECDWEAAAGPHELAETMRDELGARFGDRHGDGNVRFKLAGITAQSTAGLAAAMLCWLGKARDILAQAERQLA